MARFLVTNGNTFEPFSLEELIKPLAYKQEQHNAAQDAYDALSMDTESLANYISENEDDREAKALYDNYKAKLLALQENLWKNGVTAQTRRDLSVARRGYASDIQRLAKAVEARQTRSKEYWDSVHKNPDLIAGSDPGSFGLDNYLRDDTFGSDWFSYSGNQFMSEVGADAKAKAQSYRRDVQNKREVPGYITRVAQNGFTADEVEEAIEAVRNGSYSNLKEGAVKILATTLADHISATGAVRGKNISDEQYDRFFGYGRTGLSQGIFEPDVKDFQDIYARAALQGGSGGGQQTSTTTLNNRVIIDTTKEQLKSTGFDDYSTFYNGKNESYKNGGKQLVLPNGKVVIADNVIQGTEFVYNSPARKKGRSFFGADVALPGENFFGTTNSKQDIYLSPIGTNGRPMLDSNGNPRKIHLNTGDIERSDRKKLELDKLADSYGLSGYKDFVGIYTADGKLHQQATLEFNKLRLEHEKYVEDMRIANPDVDLDSYALSPREERKMREKYGKSMGVGSNLSAFDTASAIKRNNMYGKYSPAALVSVSTGDDHLRKEFEDNIKASFNGIVASSGKDGKLSEGSPYAIKVMGKGLTEEDGKEILDLADLWGVTKAGSEELTSDKLNTISINLFDIARNPRNPEFRFTVKTHPKNVYKASTELLGSVANEALLSNEYNGVGLDGVPTGVSTPTQAISYMMMPLTDAGYVKNMSNDEAANWWRNTCAYLGISSNEGVDAKTFVDSDAAASQLYNLVLRYLNDRLAIIRDVKNHYSPRYESYQSKDARQIGY